MQAILQRRMEKWAAAYSTCLLPLVRRGKSVTYACACNTTVPQPRLLLLSRCKRCYQGTPGLLPLASTSIYFYKLIFHAAIQIVQPALQALLRPHCCADASGSAGDQPWPSLSGTNNKCASCACFLHVAYSLSCTVDFLQCSCYCADATGSVNAAPLVIKGSCVLRAGLLQHHSTSSTFPLFAQVLQHVGYTCPDTCVTMWGMHGSALPPPTQVPLLPPYHK